MLSVLHDLTGQADRRRKEHTMSFISNHARFAGVVFVWSANALTTFGQTLPSNFFDAADDSSQRAAPVIESTVFEPPDWDVHTPGETNFFCGLDYWDNACTTFVLCSAANPNPLNGWNSEGSVHCREPHIDIANSANPGGQHLRFARDPNIGAGCTGFQSQCRERAVTADMGPQQLGPVTNSFDISISNLFGQSFRYVTIGLMITAKLLSR